VGGLFDIHGNLFEWTHDWFTRGSHRVFRGGSWGNDAANCRAANRNDGTPAYRTTYYGFRLALVPSGSARLAPAEPGD
jgi:formylglycine-generating enzyme required for sulfatase activity